MAIRKEAGGFILENTWIRRRVEIAEGPVTTLFQVRPYGAFGADDWHVTMWQGATLPYEATVILDGEEFQLSALRPNPESAIAGAFTVEESRIASWSLGQRLSLTCRPRLPGMPDVTVTLHYDLADSLPPGASGGRGHRDPACR